jgi:hypothetical protein
VVTRSFTSYHWIYWVGPILGALVASVFYLLIKALEYESVNADSDPKKVLREKFDLERGHHLETKEEQNVNLQRERQQHPSGPAEV